MNPELSALIERLAGLATITEILLANPNSKAARDVTVASVKASRELLARLASPRDPQ